MILEQTALETAATEASSVADAIIAKIATLTARRYFISLFIFHLAPLILKILF